MNSLFERRYEYTLIKLSCILVSVAGIMRPNSSLVISLTCLTSELRWRPYFYKSSVDILLGGPAPDWLTGNAGISGDGGPACYI